MSGHGIILGGGGTEYLLLVQAYSTEGEIPAAGLLGRLAVVTTVAIPSFESGGIMCKASLPSTRDDGSALQTGDICILEFTASNASFNVVKGVTVYPIGCFQWNGSAWVDRVAKYDTGSAWVYLYAFLYYLTNQCTGITSGWAARAWAAQSGVGAQAPTITIGADNVTVSFSAVNTKSGVYEIANDIDLTNFSTLKIDGYSNHNGTSQYVYLYVVPRTSTYYHTSKVAAVTPPTAGRGIVTLDVSALNATYDICIGIWANGPGSPSCTMYSLQMVP